MRVQSALVSIVRAWSGLLPGLLQSRRRRLTRGQCNCIVLLEADPGHPEPLRCRHQRNDPRRRLPDWKTGCADVRYTVALRIAGHTRTRLPGDVGAEAVRRGEPRTLTD